MSSPGNLPFSIDEAAALFKTRYGMRSEAVYNKRNVLLGRIRNRNDYTGKEWVGSVELSFSGAVGSGELPMYQGPENAQFKYTTKKVYGTAFIQRKAIYESKSPGAFVSGLQYTVNSTVIAHANHMSVNLYGDGSGIICRGAGDKPVQYVQKANGLVPTGSGANSGTVKSKFIRLPMRLTATKVLPGFTPAWVEEGRVVQLVTGLHVGRNTGGTALAPFYKILSVDHTGGFVTIGNIDKSDIETNSTLGALAAAKTNFAGTSGLCLQNSYNEEPTGLQDVVFGDSDSLYGIERQRRWQSLTLNANNSAINDEILNELVTRQGEKLKAGKIIVTNPVQIKRIKDLYETLKRITLPGRARQGMHAKLQATISFSGLEFMGDDGPIPMFADRFCPKDRLYLLNEDYMLCHKAAGSGWFMDDGTRFLRVSGKDAYEARYGVYAQNFINPTWQAAIWGLNSDYGSTTGSTADSSITA